MSADKRQPIEHQNARRGTGQDDPDDSLGAVEGETPSDPQRGNPLGSGVDDEGRPDSPIKTGQDQIGANLDETEG
ncbi:MAG: hypothetical protein WD690_06050 [Vicinamibacterales bacterium]